MNIEAINWAVVDFITEFGPLIVSIPLGILMLVLYDKSTLQNKDLT